MFTIFHWNGKSNSYAAHCSACWGVQEVSFGTKGWEPVEHGLRESWARLNYLTDTGEIGNGEPVTHVTVTYPKPRLLFGIFPFKKYRD